MDAIVYDPKGSLVRNKGAFPFTDPTTGLVFDPEHTYKADITPWLQGQIDARAFALATKTGEEVPGPESEQDPANAVELAAAAELKEKTEKEAKEKAEADAKAATKTTGTAAKK